MKKEEEVISAIMEKPNTCTKDEELEKRRGKKRALVKILHPDCKLPVKKSKKAAGYDVCSIKDIVLQPWSRMQVPLGFAITVPPGTYGRIAARSGLSIELCADVGAGVLDEDYTGEVNVVFINSSDKVICLRKGDRVAQLIFEKKEDPEIVIVNELESTERGTKGWGSTGLNDNDTTNGTTNGITNDNKDGVKTIVQSVQSQDANIPIKST